MAKDRNLTQFRLSEVGLQRLEALAQPGESLNLAAKRLLEEYLFSGEEEKPRPSQLEATEHRLNRIEEWMHNVGERLGTLEVGFDRFREEISSDRDWEEEVLDALEEARLEKYPRVDSPVDSPVDRTVDTPVDTSVDTPVDTSVDTPVEDEAPILKALEFKEYSQAELARRLSVSSSYLSQKRKAPDFKQWSRKKDIQGMEWEYIRSRQMYQGRFPD